jgi:hypothetical protein
MPVLNTATKIALGSHVANRVYSGSNLVWQPATGWTPSVIASSINTWLQADLVTGTSGATISSVADSGPDGRGYATSFGFSPTLVTAALNAKNALSFNGQGLVTTSTIGTGIVDFGLYVVWHGLSGVNACRLVDTDLMEGFWTGRSLSDNQVIGGGIGLGTDPYGIYAAANNTAWHILTFERVSGTQNILVDGGQASISAAATSTAAMGNRLLYIAGESTNYGGCIPTDLLLAEMLFIDANVAANRQKIEGYMAWKWGLQSALPTGHPYKSAAP